MKPPVIVLVSVTVALCICVFGSSVGAEEDQVKAAVIAIVKDGLEKLRNGDPRGITDACAEGVTYYSVEQDSLLVGRQALVELYGPPTNQTYYDHFDLINPTVQTHGDVAVIAFDFASFSTEDDSQLRTRWRGTYVLARFDAGWRILHIHWTLLENNLQ